MMRLAICVTPSTTFCQTTAVYILQKVVIYNGVSGWPAHLFVRQHCAVAVRRGPPQPVEALQLVRLQGGADHEVGLGGQLREVRAGALQGKGGAVLSFASGPAEVRGLTGLGFTYNSLAAAVFRVASGAVEVRWLV